MPFLNKTYSKGTKGHKLTPKMIEFVDQYMIYQNVTEAVRHTSYKTNNPARHGAELMAHPLIRDEITRRTTIRTQQSEIKAEYLLLKLMQIIEDTEDQKTADRLRAIELAGKSIALWKERQEISGPGGEAIKHEQHVKESVADFTSRISSLAERNRASSTNVVPFRGGNGGTAVAVEVLGETEPTGPEG